MRLTFLLTATCFGLALSAVAGAADQPAPAAADVEAAIDQAQTWLISKQIPSGAFAADQFALGISALATQVLALQPQGLKNTDPVLVSAFGYLKANQQPNGGIYLKEQGLGNYCTSLTLMALSTAGLLEQNKDLVAKAQAYEYGIQVPPGQKMSGGFGYDEEDGKDHQDITNTTFGIMGLSASGVPASEPHMQAALKFLQHCQNLSSVNDMPWVNTSPGQVGSGVYSPNESAANGSFQEKGDTPDPNKKLLGTGSMTYTLLSGYIALDLKPGDPRIDAALDWIKHNYRFDANPGMVDKQAKEGLLYYYLFMAKTLNLLHIDSLTLPDGRTVDWRGDLFAAIKALGIPKKVGDKDGLLFMNSASRWGEAYPTLATAYMIGALKDIDASLRPIK